MKAKIRLLVVYDSDKFKTAFEKRGFEVYRADTAEQAKIIAESYCPEAILISSGLKGVDCIELMRDIRAWSIAPVLIMTDSNDDRMLISAFENGADDCVCGMRSIAEIIARVQAALRRSVNRTADPRNIKRIGDLKIDYDDRRVFISDIDAGLSNVQYRMVALLAQNAGRVMTYEEMMRQLWGPNVGKDNLILRVNMAYIRKKIEKDSSAPRYITTRKGIGYVMADK